MTWITLTFAFQTRKSSTRLIIFPAFTSWEGRKFFKNKYLKFLSLFFISVFRFFREGCMEEEFEKIERKFHNRFWKKLYKEDEEAFRLALMLGYVSPGGIIRTTTEEYGITYPEILTEKVMKKIEDHEPPEFFDIVDDMEESTMGEFIESYGDELYRLVKQKRLPEEILEVARLKYEAEIKGLIKLYQLFFKRKLDIKKLVEG